LKEQERSHLTNDEMFLFTEETENSERETHMGKTIQILLEDNFWGIFAPFYFVYISNEHTISIL
jgi:hypothetical protein